jgi:DNA-directed RNA polymerase specialized sigma subunit
MMETANGSARKTNRVRKALRDCTLDHLSVVFFIAVRVQEHLPVHVDLGHLIRAGILALFDAASTNDRGKKARFHIYARHRIKVAILDSLRQLDWASRDLRKRHFKRNTKLLRGHVATHRRQTRPQNH